MHNTLLAALGVVAVTTMSGAATAQDTRVYRSEPRVFGYSFENSENRAVIGISTSSSGSARDTLGVLISSITPGSPAERAGLEEGHRIAAVNGVNLKLNPADVGDWDMSNMMTRRLTRELSKVDPGTEVDLRVYSSGQIRSIKVKTVAYDSLYRSSTRRSFFDDDDDRAVIGVSLGSSGSKRDTLGVLVMWLDDNGPAAKAGIEEGNRIAGIGSVDLRVNRDDAGDEMIAGVKVQRLQRELEKLKPGDEVDLRVYSDGRVRTVKVKTVAASTLNRDRDRRSIIIGPRGGGVRVAPMPPMPAIPAVPGRITRITL
jgi:S1-C subfamily serine protease